MGKARENFSLPTAALQTEVVQLAIVTVKE